MSDRIFAIEGAWSSNLSAPETIRPTLETLRAVVGVKYIHRHVETSAAVVDLLGRWVQKQYERYSIGYLAFHGEPGEVQLHRRDSLNLEALATALDGRAKGRIIHFGSCSVLHLSDDDLQRFARTTGVRAVSGYTKDVDWLDSCAFDLLVLRELLDSQRLPHAARRLHRQYSGLAGKLGFILATPGSVVDE